MIRKEFIEVMRCNYTAIKMVTFRTRSDRMTGEVQQRIILSGLFQTGNRYCGNCEGGNKEGSRWKAMEADLAGQSWGVKRIKFGHMKDLETIDRNS